ncbi:MAG: TRAP transporter small permease [Acidobacteriota bacterium]
MQQAEHSVVARLIRATALIEDALLVALLAAMVALSASQIVLRNLFDGAIIWADPVLRIAVLWVGMIGAMVATRADKQISIDAVSRFLPARWRARVRVITDLFTSGVSAVVAWNAVRLVAEDRSSCLTVIALCLCGPERCSCRSPSAS